MCLSTITKEIEPTNQEMFAWKIFRRVFYYKDKPSYYPWIYSPSGDGSLNGISHAIPVGRWHKAVHRRLYTESLLGGRGEVYESGFHAFIRKPFMSCGPNFIVARVRLRKVRIFGEQDGAKAIVADEMMIPRAKKPTAKPTKRRVKK